MATSSPRSLAVQIVLFTDGPARQLRLAAAVGAMVADARRRSGLSQAVVRYGDCSPRPCLRGEHEAAIRDAIGAAVDDVSFTFFGANLGSAGGSNALAAQGDEEAIFVLNPDTYPSPGAATALLDALADPSVGVAEARQVPVEHPKAYDPSTGDTSWASGFGSMYRRAAFDAVGGFDAHFFPLYCDDVDLSWRLRLAGWRVVHVPHAPIVHDQAISAGGAIRWSPVAARSSHLARLWLYRRYGRPDLEAEFLAAGRERDDPLLREAIEEFEERVAAGDVPDAIAEADSVATFVDGRYAPHRFGYAS